MAEDFGDDAGQQLYEWTMRIGLYARQHPGAGSAQAQMQQAVDRLLNVGDLTVSTEIAAQVQECGSRFGDEIGGGEGLGHRCAPVNFS